jgi:hypothetical protein
MDKRKADRVVFRLPLDEAYQTRKDLTEGVFPGCEVELDKSMPAGSMALELHFPDGTVETTWVLPNE